MFSEDVPISEIVLPRGFNIYLTNRGWRKTQSKFDDVNIYRSDGEEIVVPVDRALDDYENLLMSAVEKLAGIEKRSRRAIIESLVMPSSDIINFRLRDSSTKEGFISLAKGPLFLLSCQRALLAAACSVEDPQKHYQKLSRSVARAFLDECKFNTRAGSFVVNIACPLEAVEENTISDQAKSAKKDQHESFTRTVTRTLMSTMKDIVTSVNSGDDQSSLRSSSLVSSNFCKALLGMCPENESSSLEVSAFDTIGTPIGQPATIPQAYFKQIESLASKLTPSVDPSLRFITGLVTDLHGERTADGRPAGDIEVSFQYNDEDLIKARVTLSVDDYGIAVKAHSNGHYVSLRGTLKLGSRAHKISDVREFRDLQSG